MLPGGPAPDLLYLEVLRRLQLTVSYRDRDRVARQIAGALTHRLGAAGIAPVEPGNPTLVNQLLDEGYAQLGQLLRDDQVEAILADLAARPVAPDYFAAHTQGAVLERTAAEATELPHISYPLADVIGAPHLIELANSRFMLGLAQSYLGCVPTLYSVNLMIAHPTATLSPSVQTYHRDHDDFRFVTLFVFLSDVARDEDGAHAFIRGSHRLDRLEQAAAQHSEFDLPATLTTVGKVRSVDMFFEQVAGIDLLDLIAQRFLMDREVRIRGPAGTAFLVDTYGLHKGLAPATGRRIVFWARYGLYPNLAHATYEVTPAPWSAVASRLPDDARTRYVNRLLFS